jgi:muramoyltetrapeptide carboxypeptidase
VRDLLRPPRLRPGDTIGVAALSGPVDPDLLREGCSQLENMGYVVRPGFNLELREPLLGLAGSDSERAAAYLDLVRDPAVKAIVFARGGYGIARTLPLLDPGEIARTPKIHCGFSDVTVLSSFLLERCGLPSFHGPMVAADLARGLDALSARFFPSMLEGQGPGGVSFDGEEAEVLSEGSTGPHRASGWLVGGCLSLLAASIGTPFEYDYRGALLFFEDIGEEAYRIDRMLGTLMDAGRFAKLRGILIGSLSRVTFSGVEDPDRLRAVLRDRLAPLGVPVVAGLPVGHRGSNVTLPVGARATWDGMARTLSFEEEIVL